MIVIGSYQGNIIVLLGQIINGVAGMFTWGSLQAAASIAANQQQDKYKGNQVISNFSFINSLAQLAGPAFGGFVSDLGSFQLVFYIVAGLNLVSMVLAAALPGSYASRLIKKIPEQLEPPMVKESLWRSYGNGCSMMRTNKPFATAILLNGILFMLIDVRTTFFPLFLSNMELTNTQIGSMLSVSALAALIVRPLAGHLMNGLGYHRIMMISIFSGAGCLLLLLFEPGYWVLAAIVFVWGVCTSVNQPVALMMVSQTVGQGEQGLGMSIRTMSNRFVQLTNPVLFGAMTTIIGLTMGFGAMGVLLIGIGVLYHRQYRTGTS
jgi:MFS family permease